MQKNVFVCAILAISFTLFLASSAYSQQTKRIVQIIEVKNNKVISTTTVLAKLKTKVHSEFSASILSEDIKRLYATGFFSDVSADVLDVQNGVKVVLKVVEKPLLEEIIFQGNKKIRKKRLLSKMKSKQNEIFDQYKLKEDIEELKRFYAEKGFSLAEITSVLEQDEKNNKVKVKININEGNRVRIKSISFAGNENFKPKRLLKLIKTKKRAFFNSGFLKPEVLDEDTERISSFYHSQGYIETRVMPQLTYNKKKTKMFLAFKIEEGKLYRVGIVEFQGNTIVSEDVLKGKMKLTEDNIYSEEKLRNDISTIQSYYFDRGYISAQVKIDTVLNAQTGKVDVTYGISESTVAYVDKINIKGNTRSRDAVIRREIRLFPGDRYNGEKLRRSRQRLYNLDYFEEVTFDTAEKPTTLPDKYDLNVLVKEAKTGEFSFGAGYSSVDRFIGFIDLTQKNFDLFRPPTFTGGGQRMRIRMEFGTERKDYELSFMEPWFLGYPLTFGFNIYNRTRDWDKYDERRVGGNIYVAKDFGEYWQAKLIHRYEGIRIHNIDDDASLDIKEEEGKNYISSVISEIVRDTRDNIYNPTMGMSSRFSCELAGKFFGGDKDFIKYYIKNSKYFSLTKKTVFEFRTTAGLAESLSHTAPIPIYERFYSGGASTIRGYKERRVGPEGENSDPVGGRLMLIFNAEYTYQLIDNLKWAFFYDTGNVWARPAELEWDSLKLKSGIGTGMRIKTPLGPIRLDYGYALNPKPGDARGRFHFTMSHEF